MSSDVCAAGAASVPYETEYPMLRVMEVAELAASFDDEAVAPLELALEDPDSAVRFWAVQGLLARVELDGLSGRLADSSPSVRAIAAEALGRFGNDAQRKRALTVLIDLASLERYDIYVVMLALNALDRMGRRALSAVDSIRVLPTSHPSVMPSMKSYVPRLVEKILADVGA